MRKYAKIENMKHGGANSGSGGMGSKTEGPMRAKAQTTIVPVLRPLRARVLISNLQLSILCTKTKTCNIKNVAWNLTIPMI